MAGDIDRKRLWGRSGSRCSICNVELTELDGLDSIVGDEAHIRSPKPNGPRYEDGYPKELLDTYANLILLCKAHHKLVDDNWAVFPVDALEELKKNHEQRVRRSLAGGTSNWSKSPKCGDSKRGRTWPTSSWPHRPTSWATTILETRRRRTSSADFFRRRRIGETSPTMWGRRAAYKRR